MKKTQKLFMFVLFGACISIGLLIVFYPYFFSLKSPRIIPADQIISVRTRSFQIIFPVSMNRESVENHLSITPAQRVDMIWDGPVLEIRPQKAFLSGSLFEIILKHGATSEDGREYTQDHKWFYSIRTPAIVYLGNVTTSPEVWKYDFTTKQNTALTNTGGLVTDLTASPEGDVVLFIQKNSSGGSDIFAIFNDVWNPTLLVSCGKDSCNDPAISSDGRLFAFSRNREPEGGTKSMLPYIYTGIIKNGEKGITPLITENTIPGILPSFSPDGKKISFYDTKSEGIRIVNKSGENDFLLGTNRMQRGSWSPDGDKFIFIDDEMGEKSIYSRLYTVDISTSSINEPLKSVISQKELGEPDWSPDGASIVVGTRAEGGPLTRQLVIYNLDSLKSTQITTDSSVINASPRWSPDGQYIVFQQARLGISNTKPVIALWDSIKKDVTTIAEDAALPVWLP